MNRVALLRRLLLLAVAVGLVGSAAWRWGMPALAHVVARAARSAEDPTRAYELLVRMDHPALGALVRNATDADPVVSHPARQAIMAEVDAWRANANLANRAALSRRMNHLLEHLTRSTPRMTTSAVAWTEALSEQLLGMLPKLAPEARSELITGVDVLLADLAIQPERDDLPMPPREMAEEVEVASAEPITPAEPEAFSPLPSAPLAIETQLPEPVTPAPIAEHQPAPVITDNSPADVPQEDLWSPKWRSSGPASVAQAPPDTIEAPGEEDSDPDGLPSEADGFSSMSDRELLAELLANADTLRLHKESLYSAQGPGRRRAAMPLDPRLESLLSELANRGYTGARPEHLRLLLSDDANDRIQLVDRLMVERSGDTVRLLMLLLKDAEPDVRLAAVTALGSSSQRNLVEAAWSSAIRDSDPRFASIAEQLQQRLR